METKIGITAYSMAKNPQWGNLYTSSCTNARRTHQIETQNNNNK
jgi:hypothetical protein